MYIYLDIVTTTAAATTTEDDILTTGVAYSATVTPPPTPSNLYIIILSSIAGAVVMVLLIAIILLIRDRRSKKAVREENKSDDNEDAESTYAEMDEDRMDVQENYQDITDISNIKNIYLTPPSKENEYHYTSDVQKLTNMYLSVQEGIGTGMSNTYLTHRELPAIETELEDPYLNPRTGSQSQEDKLRDDESVAKSGENSASNDYLTVGQLPSGFNIQNADLKPEDDSYLLVIKGSRINELTKDKYLHPQVDEAFETNKMIEKLKMI